MKYLANAFLNHKQTRLDANELSPQTWRDCKEAGDFLVENLGKHRVVSDLGPHDFAALRIRMAKRWVLHRLAKNIQYTRSMFKYGFDGELIEKPVRLGPGFDRPSKKTFRIERGKQGAKLFTAEEIHRLLDAANDQLKTLILLGINYGFGNADCANLPLSMVDLDAGRCYNHGNRS